MDIVLVDTSVWINFFRGIETNASKFLKNNITNIVITTCPIIVQEMLQGVIFDNDRRTVKSHSDNLTKLNENAYDMAVEAADLYRTLRKQGITVRKPNDYLIAVYAIKNKVILLQDDRDFQMIAQQSSLRIMNF